MEGTLILFPLKYLSARKTFFFLFLFFLEVVNHRSQDLSRLPIKPLLSCFPVCHLGLFTWRRQMHMLLSEE